VRAEPFGSLEQAESWLDSVRGDRDRTAEELERAGRLLNRVLHAHRVGGRRSLRARRVSGRDARDPDDLERGLAGALERMEAALKRHRLGA
jgi:hypothetical protein